MSRRSSDQISRNGLMRISCPMHRQQVTRPCRDNRLRAHAETRPDLEERVDPHLLSARREDKAHNYESRLNST